MSFTRVKALKPPRSVFDGSYEKKFDCDMGECIPVCLEEMVPGDTFKVGNEIVIRFQPLNSPILHEVNAYVHYFFVPTRLIFDKWEDFITGGEDGNDTTVLPRFYKNGGSISPYTAAQLVGQYSLYDYFGMPLLANNAMPGGDAGVGVAGFEFRPLAFPWRCYNLCWNEYYRDETLQNEVDLDQPLVLHRNWSKDYFTSALPWQQRGSAPALPISGTLPVSFDGSSDGSIFEGVAVASYGGKITGSSSGLTYASYRGNGSYNTPDGSVTASVDISNAATFDVADLRLAFQVQKWMERNMRSGVRYTEFLHSHFAVSPRDDRLQRPEYLGGSKSPIIVSEVVQTSENGTTPQGTLKGKAITADRNFVCSYTAKEFGYLIGIMSVLPKPSYQQGVDRKWLRSSRYDFYFPEFAHLSEQAVTTEEIYALKDRSSESGISNDTIFGYQARYNEMRMNQNKVCGSLRNTLDYWHLGRQFATVPQLNSDFITCNATNDDLKRIFAVQNVPGMIVNFANIITMIRPLPKFGEPGLIDHN